MIILAMRNWSASVRSFIHAHNLAMKALPIDVKTRTSGGSAMGASIMKICASAGLTGKAAETASASLN